jgi:hypothetical protein
MPFYWDCSDPTVMETPGMARRFSISLVLLGALAALGANPYRVRTANFVIEAPTEQIAQQVGQYAEIYRKEKAMQWLGQEMPTWPEPLPVRVTILADRDGGATTFVYGSYGVQQQWMHIEGRLDKLLNSVLPHEITHTVFAQYFRCASPRWSDEGGSVLSEDQPERNRHDHLARDVLRVPGLFIPLKRLFILKDYPEDGEHLMALYAEGYSVSNFLVDKGGDKGRQTFLHFVATGMRNNEWDNAVRSYYGYRDVNDLERAWVTSLRQPREAAGQLVKNHEPSAVEPANRVVSRQTAPPLAVALDGPRPISRAQAPSDGDGEPYPPRSSPGQVSRPTYAQDYPNVPAALAPRVSPPGPVILGAPQSMPPPPPIVLGSPVPIGPPPTAYPSYPR